VSSVAVTGGAGFLGQRVLLLLSGRSDVDRVVSIDRVGADLSGPEGHKVDSFALDLADQVDRNDDRLGRALDSVDAVIHLAWSVGEPSAALRAPGVSPNLVSLRRVLEAASDANVRGLVHLSSATVYGAWPDNQIPLSENAPIRPNPGFTFGLEKAEAERLVADWADDRPEVATCILRPAVTVGVAGPALYRALGGTSGPAADDAARPLQFLHVDDLASAVVVAWEQRLKGVYNVAPDTGVSEDTARALAGGVARLTLPGRLVRPVAAWTWLLWRRGTPKQALAYSLYPWVIAPDKLRAAGWVPDYSSEEALVSADDRSHWSDIPPSRRQELALTGAAVGVLATIFGAVWLVLGLRRRSGAARRRSG
jgi:nucleoside-diphosphate-sugar epimerase